MGPWLIRSLAKSLPGVFAPWPFRSLAISFPGPFAPWPFTSLELSLHGSFAADIGGGRCEEMKGEQSQEVWGTAEAPKASMLSAIGSR